jgi:hypothetical protein
VIAAEFALVLPILVALLFGAFDMGSALVINQKAIAASQMMADLASRTVALTQDEIDDIVYAGQQAMRPYSLETFSYSILSIEYADDVDDPVPSVCWDYGPITTTQAMLDSTVPLAAPGEGLVVVTIDYDYEPVFATYLMDMINMREVAFARGRRSPVVSFQSGVSISCPEA